jgi:hypothetical protein
MPLLSICISVVKAPAKKVASPAPRTPFISAAGCRGRVVPRLRDIMDTRHEHGGSRAGVGRLSNVPALLNSPRCGKLPCHRGGKYCTAINKMMGLDHRVGHSLDL